MAGPRFVAVGGEEGIHRLDLPSCCRRAEHESTGGSFDCPGCGASWRVAPKDTSGKLACGCLVGDEGPIILCRTAQRSNQRVNDLIPPFGDDDADSWNVFHEALEQYRRHLGGRA